MSSKEKLPWRYFELSKDNYDSCILTFLRSLSAIDDDEDASIESTRVTDDDGILVQLKVWKAERQLRLPLGDHE